MEYEDRFSPNWDVNDAKPKMACSREGSLKQRLEWYAEGGLIMIENAMAAYRWDPDEEGTVWTCEFFVHPDHRGQGIGGKLIDRIKAIPGVKAIRSITYSHRHDVSRMYLKANHVVLHDDGTLVWWLWRRDSAPH